MSSQTSQLDGENLHVAKCRQGDATALTDLRDKCHNSLLAILLARGVDRAEADDLLADLWADCVPGNNDRPSLLEKFSGKCTLQGWLATVATNRWFDLKRKQARRVDLTRNDAATEGPDALESRPAADARMKEDQLVALLRESLQAAFARCSAEAMVLLRLVYLHELTH